MIDSHLIGASLFNVQNILLQLPTIIISTEATVCVVVVVVVVVMREPSQRSFDHYLPWQQFAKGVNDVFWRCHRVVFYTGEVKQFRHLIISEGLPTSILSGKEGSSSFRITICIVVRVIRSGFIG